MLYNTTCIWKSVESKIYIQSFTTKQAPIQVKKQDTARLLETHQLLLPTPGDKHPPFNVITALFSSYSNHLTLQL